MSVFDEDVAKTLLVVSVPFFLSLLSESMKTSRIGLGITCFLVLVSLYLGVTYLKMRYYRYLCKKQGMTYFYLYPTAIIPFLFREKLGVPTTIRICHRIHVTTEDLRHLDWREAIKAKMRSEINLMNQKWQADDIIVGSTFMELGKHRYDRLQREIISGPLYFFHPWIITVGKILKEQYKFMGRHVTKPDDIRWKTVVYRFTKLSDI